MDGVIMSRLQAHRLADSHFDDGSDHGDKLLGLTTKFLSPLSGFDDMLDHRTAFGAITFEQFFIATTVQDKVELPDQIPNVM